MLPYWKFLRELRRVKEQIKAFVALPISKWRQHQYDSRKHDLIHVHTGELPIGQDVAILLIYQPDGIPESVFHTLRHLKSAGFAPFPVVNSPISASERNKLCAHSSLMMERPNFGYDFGGYRDALLHVLQKHNNLEHVVVLNDSVWFPIFADCDHLDRMRKIDGDLIGYSYSKGFRRKKNAHVQSYFFMLKGNSFLKSDSLRQFWENLSVSDSRYHTIRHCEMNMTKHFRGLQRRIGWLFSADDLSEVLSKDDRSDSRKVLEYYIHTGNKRASIFAKALDTGELGLESLVQSELDEGNMGRNIIGGPPFLVFDRLRFAAVKKSRSYNYQVQRRALLQSGFGSQLQPIVLEEIMNHD